MSWQATISGASEIVDVTKIKTNRALDTIGTAEITVDNPWGTKNGLYKAKYFEPISIGAPFGNCGHDVYAAALNCSFDVIGVTPSKFGCSVPANTSIKVLSSYEGHNYCIEVFDNTNANYPYMRYNFDSPQTSGTIEFYMRRKSGYGGNGIFGIGLKDVDSNSITAVLFLDTNLVTIVPDTIQAISDDTWYHIRLYFNCDTDTMNIWVNDEDKGSFNFGLVATSIASLQFESSSAGTHTNSYFYVDAVDFSWSDGYYTGRNKIINYLVFTGRIENIQFHAHDMNLLCVDFTKELTDNQLYNKKFTYAEGYIKSAGLDTGSSVITCEALRTGESFTWTTNQWANKFITFDRRGSDVSYYATGDTVSGNVDDAGGTYANTNFDGTDYWLTNKNVVSSDPADADGYSILYIGNITASPINSAKVIIRVWFYDSWAWNHETDPAFYIYNHNTATHDKFRDLQFGDEGMITVNVPSVQNYITGGTMRIAIAGGVLYKMVFYPEMTTSRHWHYARVDVSGSIIMNNDIHEIWSNTATALTLKQHHHPGSGETAVYGAFPLVYDTGCYNIKSHDDTGNLMATFNFASDAIDGDPAGWTITENDDATIKVKANIGGLARAVDHYDDGSGYTVMYDDFTAQTDAAIEFWARADAAYNLEISLKNAATARIYLYFQWATSKLSYHNGAALVDIADIALNTNYHCRLVFNCASDTYDVFLNGYQKGTGCPFYSAATNLDRVQFYWNTNAPGGHCYIGAVDYSWDTDTGQYQVPYFVNRNRYFAKREAFGGMPYANPLGSCGIATGDTFKIIERNSNIVANLVNQQGVNLTTGEATVSTGNHFSGVNCESRTTWDITRQLAEESECRTWVDLNKKLHWQNTGDMPTGSAWTEIGGDFMQHPIITYSPEEYRSACIVIGKNCTGDLQTGSVMNNVGKTEVIKNDGLTTKEECNSYGLAYLAHCNRVDPTMNCVIMDKYDLDLGQKQTITCQTLTGETMIVEGIQREYIAGETGHTLATVRLGNLPTNLSPQDKIVHYFGQLKQKLAEVNAYK